MPHQRIVVVGSVNMDLVVSVPAIPQPGQTILGHAFQTIPGGKGANQAVAAARLGAAVSFVGRVGNDSFAQPLREGLGAAGVDCAHLQTCDDAPSGVALIAVSEAGENAICVAGGANAHLSPADIDSARPVLERAAVCLLQLESPLETVAHAISVARSLGVKVVLDPAPAPDALPEALRCVDVITPNESEAAQLVGSSAERATPSEIAQSLRRLGPRAVVLKLGANGCLASDHTGDVQIAPHRVDVVDTTAAGDAFSAGLAVALAEGHDLSMAARFANAAGAIACTRFGAQTSAPSREAVERLL